MQSIISFIVAIIAAVGLYPKAGYIVDINNGSVVIEDATGNLWETETDADDWCIGDGVSMIMYNNETETIYDDVIVAARYNGFWR